jgi:hypothetical protein
MDERPRYVIWVDDNELFRILKQRARLEFSRLADARQVARGLLLLFPGVRLEVLSIKEHTLRRRIKLSRRSGDGKRFAK